MKYRFLAAPALLLFVVGFASSADRSLTGWISDSSRRAKGAHEGAAECTKKCVKKVYVVDAQDKAAAHAGEHVMVKGSINGDNLKLSGIESAA